MIFSASLCSRYTGMTVFLNPNPASISLLNPLITMPLTSLNPEGSSHPHSRIMRTSSPGTYALVVLLEKTATISIGKLGAQQFLPGYYVYLGSALGPGGLRARVGRHLQLRGSSKLHWHIDYLLRKSTLIEIWWGVGDNRHECSWAEILGKTGMVFPLGFGSSDCNCDGHLVAFRTTSALCDGQERLKLEVGPLFQCEGTSQGLFQPVNSEEEDNGNS